MSETTFFRFQNQFSSASTCAGAFSRCAHQMTTALKDTASPVSFVFALVLAIAGIICVSIISISLLVLVLVAITSVLLLNLVLLVPKPPLLIRHPQ